MALTFNLRHLEDKPLRLVGELPVADLELETLDEVIKVNQPLSYDVEVQELDTAILVRGRLALVLDCECVRCLKPFQYTIELNDWACHLPTEGEDKVSTVNGSVDLTPYIREDASRVVERLQHLEALIRDMLVFARGEIGSRELLSIKALVGEVFANCDPLARGKGASFSPWPKQAMPRYGSAVPIWWAR